MLPLGESLNLGMAFKQGRESSFGWVLHKPVSFLPRTSLWAETMIQLCCINKWSWRAHVAELSCPSDTFHGTLSTVVPGLCFCTCLGGAVRDVSFVGGTATQPVSVTWCHW